MSSLPTTTLRTSAARMVMCSKTCFAVLLVVASLGGLSAQVPALGQCPKIETMSNFDMSRYMGQWFEAERYFAVFEFAGKCVSANYSVNPEGKVNIINKQLSSLTGISSTIEGEVNLLGRSDEGKLTVRFPSLPVMMDAPYWILGTDYDNYAVVWSCTNFGFFNTRNAWILTRARDPPLHVMEQAYAVVDRNGISRGYFIRTDQKSCSIAAYH